MLQHYTIQSVIVRDHVELLRREARQARLAAWARRHGSRSSRRSR
jgi:hypothetical protein